jgi:hypothetical protein
MNCRQKQGKAAAQHADVLCEYLLQVGCHIVSCYLHTIDLSHLQEALCMCTVLAAACRSMFY